MKRGRRIEILFAVMAIALLVWAGSAALSVLKRMSSVTVSITNRSAQTLFDGRAGPSDGGEHWEVLFESLAPGESQTRMLESWEGNLYLRYRFGSEARPRVEGVGYVTNGTGWDVTVLADGRIDSEPRVW